MPEHAQTTPASPQPEETGAQPPRARPRARERGKMRRRLRQQKRMREALLLDLGALVLELHRHGRRAPELLQAKAAELSAVDTEVRALAEALDADESLLELVAAGVAGSCQSCGSLLSTDARYCPACGAPAVPGLAGDARQGGPALGRGDAGRPAAPGLVEPPAGEEALREDAPHETETADWPAPEEPDAEAEIPAEPEEPEPDADPEPEAEIPAEPEDPEPDADPDAEAEIPAEPEEPEPEAADEPAPAPPTAPWLVERDDEPAGSDDADPGPERRGSGPFRRLVSRRGRGRGEG